MRKLITLPVVCSVSLASCFCACSSASLSGGSSSANKSKTAKTAEDSGDESEGENTKADIPVAVNGAFLCRPTTDGPSSAGNTTVGCRLVVQGAKSGKLSDILLRVVTKDQTVLTPAVAMAAPESTWDFFFQVADALAKSSLKIEASMKVAGTATSVSTVMAPSGFDTADAKASFDPASSPEKATPKIRIIFATKNVFSVGTDAGGFSTKTYAREICQTAGESSAFIGKSWKPLLSTNDFDAASFLIKEPVYNAAGKLVAAAESFWLKHENPVGFDQFGNSVYGKVWTGTRADGKGTVDTCNNWQSTSGGLSEGDGGWKATIGNVEAFSDEWIATATESCEHGPDVAPQFHLYCISDAFEKK